MKRFPFSLLLLGTLMLVALPLSAQHHHGGGWFSSKEKSPAIAAALSLQPLPIALGQFYVGDWERGILYTTAEVALAIPAVALLSKNRGAGHRSYYYYDDPYRQTWTDAERERFYYLAGGYLLVKIVSAFDAGYSAEQYNRSNDKVSLRYDEQTNSYGLTMKLPF